MTIAELLLQDYDIEISNTRRTLERVPEDKPDWAPHPKSMKMGALAMHCASLPNFAFTTREGCLQQLAESSAKCRAAIARAGDEHLAALWKFSFGEKVISQNPRSMTFRTMCFDHLIHHTAQLGVYLRLNDIPVPGLYGPSADEQWTAK
jgi:hypothetical protein